MTLAYIAQLGFKVQKTDVNAQKIDEFLLKIYSIAIVAFQIFDKLGHSYFFQKTFLLAEISIKIFLGILFLTFSNIDI